MLPRASGYRVGMVIFAVLATVLIAAAIGWWLLELRRGSMLEGPDETIRRAQDPRQSHTNGTEPVSDEAERRRGY